MSANNDYFGVDAEKGAVVLRRALDYAAFSEDVGAGVIRLSVVARSNKPGSLTDTAQVTVTVDPALLPVILQSAQGPVPAWLQVSCTINVSIHQISSFIVALSLRSIIYLKTYVLIIHI